MPLILLREVPLILGIVVVVFMEMVQITKPLLPRGVAKEIPPYMSFRLTVEEEPAGGMVKQKKEFLFVNPL